MKWTEDNLERLRKMWEDGKTASECARALGTTRNSVLGKVNRLGFTKRENPVTTDALKFERLVDLIADQPDNHMPILEAARRVSLKREVAWHMWTKFIEGFAYHPQAGLELYP